MKYLIYIILISSSLNQYSLYIKNIYNNLNKDSYIDNNFQLFFDIISGQVIPNNLIINNMFDINLQSDNLNEQNVFINFNCNLYGPTNITEAYIKCILKEKIPENINGPFYFTKNNFDRSIQINYENNTYNFTLKTMEQPYYLGIIKKNFLKFNFIFQNPYNIIPIVMGLNGKNLYSTIIAITSIIKTSNPTTKYDFYIIYPNNYNIKNLKKLRSLEKKYKNKCSIKTIEFLLSKINSEIYIFSYYRLSLSNLLPYINKIIWLDDDTITYKDLNEMYNIDMENFYYKGLLDNPRHLDHITKDNDHYICIGVLLINLKKLREDNIEIKYNRFIQKYYNRLKQHDQTIINSVGFNKIGSLPPKYGIFNINHKILFLKFTLGGRSKERYTWLQLKRAYEKPTVLHCVKKVWKSLKYYGAKIWWKFAKDSDFFYEICKKYSKTCKAMYGKKILNKYIKKIKLKKNKDIGNKHNNLSNNV